MKMKKINFRFNSILFIFFCINEFIIGLVSPEPQGKAPLDVVYDMYPYASIVIAILVSIVIIFCLSKIIEVYWNLFVSDVFKIRAIDYQEALSLGIVIAFLLN